jgi:hypothetical protein
MFWIFAAFVSLMLFAVMLGQYSVWFVLLKLSLIVALVVIAAMGTLLLYRKLKLH